MKKTKLWMCAAILALCGMTVLTSCSNDDNPAGQQGEYAGVPLIIYDTDIGSSTDDLFAEKIPTPIYKVKIIGYIGNIGYIL